MALADVVQDRGQQQQVRAGTPGGPTGCHPRAVSIRCRSTVNRWIGSRCGMDRSRSQPGSRLEIRPGLVEVLPGGDHRLARHRAGPGTRRARSAATVGQRRAGLGQPQHGGRGHRQPGLRGGRGGPDHQGGIGGRVDGPGQHGLALLLDDAVGQRGAFDPADQPAADVGDRALRAAQRPVDPVPGQVAGVVDGPRRCRRRAAAARRGRPARAPRDRVLVLHLQPVGGPAGQGLHHVTDVQQRRPGLLQTLVRAVGHPGGGDRAHHHQVAQPAAGFLQVGGGGEGQLAGSFGAFLAGRPQRLEPVLGVRSPVGQHPAVQGDGQFGIPGDVPQVQHAEHGRQVGAGDLPGTADRADRVVEPDLGIPDRVPQPLGEHAGVGRRGLGRVQQHQIQVGERRELPPAVARRRRPARPHRRSPRLPGRARRASRRSAWPAPAAEPDRVHRSGSATGLAVPRNRPPSPQANSAYPYRAS